MVINKEIILFNIIHKFNCFSRVLLFIVLNSLLSAIAKPIGQPIIASAVTDCKKAYLIQIFENGSVEYRGGYGVKAIGKRKTHINKQILKALLKKFENAGFVQAANLVELPAWNRHRRGLQEAIRLRQGEREAIFFNADRSINPLITALRSDIIHATKAERWVTDNDPVYSCLGEYAINFNEIKLIQK
jgi:hypothetical protein